MSSEQQKFVILMNGFNAGQWIHKSAMSAISQSYSNFRIIAMDDGSSDSTLEILRRVQNEKLEIHTNKTGRNLFQTGNLYHAHNCVSDSYTIIQPDEIVVSLDFDDWLASPLVLEKLNAIYKDPNVWMTYGLYEEWPKRDVSFLYHPYPDDVVYHGSYRQYKWLGSHLRTWRSRLFTKIAREDFIDPRTNWFYSAAGDQIFMLPMFEMARERARHIHEVLYIYNRTNPASEDRIVGTEQERISRFVRNGGIKPYSRLEAL